MEPGIDLEPASGELNDEVDSAGAGFADDIHERLSAWKSTSVVNSRGFLQVLFVRCEYMVQHTDRNNFGLAILCDGTNTANKVVIDFQHIIDN